MNEAKIEYLLALCAHTSKPQSKQLTLTVQEQATLRQAFDRYIHHMQEKGRAIGSSMRPGQEIQFEGKTYKIEGHETIPFQQLEYKVRAQDGRRFTLVQTLWPEKEPSMSGGVMLADDANRGLFLYVDSLKDIIPADRVELKQPGDEITVKREIVEVITYLGMGGQGTVYLVRHKRSGQLFTAKLFASPRPSIAELPAWRTLNEGPIPYFIYDPVGNIQMSFVYGFPFGFVKDGFLRRLGVPESLTNKLIEQVSRVVGPDDRNQDVLDISTFQYWKIDTY